MKGILKMAYVEGITVQEARTRTALLKKAAAKRLPIPQTPEIDLLKEQLQAVQAELKNLRDKIIPKIDKDIKTLTVDLAEANGKLNHIDKRFDDVLKRQEENAESQAGRFDKLDHFMNTVMKTLSISKTTPAHTQQRPSHTTTPSQKNTDRYLLLRRDDVMLSCPLTPSAPSSYFELNDQEIMDQSANHYD
jgi:chromosome segregation ATPase